MKKRLLRALLTGAAAALLTVSGTAAQELTPIDDYPAASLQITVPLSEGGGTDVLIRALAPKMQEYLGVPVMVVNKPGRGCALGYTAAAKEQPDGSAIVAGVAELLGLSQNADFKYSFRDFEPVCNFNSCYETITVRTDAPYGTIEEFVDYMQRNPGTVRFANSGRGGPWHILASVFAEDADAEFVDIPFDGGGPAVLACVAGSVDAVNVSVAEVKEYVDAGQLKILLTYKPGGLEDYPDVPIAEDKGYRGTGSAVFRGFLAPKGTPQEVLDDIDAAVRYALADPEVQAFMEANLFTADYLNGEEFYALLEELDGLVSIVWDDLGLG